MIMSDILILIISLNIMIPAINNNHLSQFQEQSDLIILLLFQFKLLIKFDLWIYCSLMIDFDKLIIPGADTFVDTTLPDCAATVCIVDLFVFLSTVSINIEWKSKDYVMKM